MSLTNYYVRTIWFFPEMMNALFMSWLTNYYVWTIWFFSRMMNTFNLDVQIARLRLLPHLASKSIACISRFSSFIFFSLPVSQWGWIVDWVDVNWTSLSLLYKIVPDQVLDMLDLAAGVAFVISCFVVRKIKFRLNWKSVILLTTQKNRVQISPTLIVWSLLWWSNRPIWFCFLEILKN